MQPHIAHLQQTTRVSVTQKTRRTSCSSDDSDKVSKFTIKRIISGTLAVLAILTFVTVGLSWTDTVYRTALRNSMIVGATFGPAMTCTTHLGNDLVAIVSTESSLSCEGNWDKDSGLFRRLYNTALDVGSIFKADSEKSERNDAMIRYRDLGTAGLALLVIAAIVLLGCSIALLTSASNAIMFQLANVLIGNTLIFLLAFIFITIACFRRAILTVNFGVLLPADTLYQAPYYMPGPGLIIAMIVVVIQIGLTIGAVVLKRRATASRDIDMC